MRSLYLVDDGELYWVSAESPEEALRTNCAVFDMTLEEYVADCDPQVRRLPDAEPVKVYQDTPYRDPTPSITKTAAEWAAEKSGVVSTSAY